MFARTVALTTVLFAATVFAQDQLYISVGNNLDNQLAGLTFTDGDVVLTDSAGSTASIFAAESVFSSSTSFDLDAFHILPNGNWLVSGLVNNLDFNGPVTYLDGDVVEYNPNTGEANLFFSEALLTGTSPDVSAVTIGNSGNMVFSTYADSFIGGTSWEDGSIVEYDTGAGTATVLEPASDIFDDGSGDIYAIHALASGNYLISPASDEMIGGTMVRDGDLAEYDPVSNSIIGILFSEDNFGGDNSDDIYAAYYVPEPATGVLLALAGLFAIRRR